ncbi:MAG: FIST N-terminal domain-containing protein, partial [Clostridiaceae bacterium]
MRNINIIYKSKKDIEEINDKDYFNDKNTLVMVFSGICQEDYIQSILKDIKGILPKCKIIGSTSAGEICCDKNYEKETVISICRFENIELNLSFIEDELKDEYEIGKDIGGKLIKGDTKALIMFAN